MVEVARKRRMRCPHRCSHYLTASHKQTITHKICRDRRPRLSASLFARSLGGKGCSHQPKPSSERTLSQATVEFCKQNIEGDHGRVPESECNELLGFVRVVEGACVILKFALSLLLRTLPQSPLAPAPSRREPLKCSPP